MLEVRRFNIPHMRDSCLRKKEASGIAFNSVECKAKEDLESLTIVALKA